MRQFKGELITYLIKSDTDRNIEQRRLKAYLKGYERFNYKQYSYPTDPTPKNNIQPEQSIVPEIII